MTVGMPADDPNMGPLISAEQYERVCDYISRGKAGGAVLACGGGRPAGLEKGYFVEPTVFQQLRLTRHRSRGDFWPGVVG